MKQKYPPMGKPHKALLICSLIAGTNTHQALWALNTKVVERHTEATQQFLRKLTHQNMASASATTVKEVNKLIKENRLLSLPQVLLEKIVGFVGPEYTMTMTLYPGFTACTPYPQCLHPNITSVTVSRSYKNDYMLCDSPWQYQSTTRSIDLDTLFPSWSKQSRNDDPPSSLYPYGGEKLKIRCYRCNRVIPGAYDHYTRVDALCHQLCEICQHNPNAPYRGDECTYTITASGELGEITTICENSEGVSLQRLIAQFEITLAPHSIAVLQEHYFRVAQQHAYKKEALARRSRFAKGFLSKIIFESLQPLEFETTRTQPPFFDAAKILKRFNTTSE